MVARVDHPKADEMLNGEKKRFPSFWLAAVYSFQAKSLFAATTEAIPAVELVTARGSRDEHPAVIARTAAKARGRTSMPKC